MDNVTMSNQLYSKHSFSIIIITILIILAGCSHVYDSEPTNTTVGTSIEGPISPNTEYIDSTKVDAQTESQNISSQEQEYINSTQWFGETIGLNTDRHTHTDFIDHQGFPDNTVGIALQTDNQSVLERSIMDGAELVAAITIDYTLDNESSVQNGTSAPIHQPDMVHVNIHDQDGNLIGRFDVDPALARDYRDGDTTVEAFANSTLNSYSAVKLYNERGQRPPKYYLNQSELDVWMSDFAKELNDSDNLYDKPYPTAGIRANISKFEVLNEFEFSSDEYGQNFISARSTSWGSYWRTHLNSFARTPERLNILIHRSNGRDVAARMDKKHAKEALQSLMAGKQQNVVLKHYLDQGESRFLEQGESAFEDF